MAWRLNMGDLRKSLKAYLQGRRALGYKLYESGLLLTQFVNYLEEEGAAFITQTLALQWAVLPQKTQPAQWAVRLRVVRHFARYMSALDPRTEIPPPSLLPYRYSRTKPYIYSKRQILKLIEAAQRLPSRSGIRALTYAALFGLIAATGMRISETLGLDRDDVNLHKGILTVCETKYGRPRLLPIHLSTVKALRQYADRRDQAHPKAKCSKFFVAEDGARLTPCTVRWTFNRLSYQIGLRAPSDHRGPRIHDLRHTFVVQTLQRWYREEMNVEQHLPHLAAYLGHRHVKDTYWYLTATPDLLRLAIQRMESIQEGLL